MNGQSSGQWAVGSGQGKSGGRSAGFIGLEAARYPRWFKHARELAEGCVACIDAHNAMSAQPAAACPNDLIWRESYKFSNALQQIGSPSQMRWRARMDNLQTLPT
ncbi:MAG TPA: hypothetical protein PKD26_09130 [Pyrinomonadaceae bacterium]|nr:hypothetical protein [Pyrinomonadaceae bacterium]